MGGDIPKIFCNNLIQGRLITPHGYSSVMFSGMVFITLNGMRDGCTWTGDIGKRRLLVQLAKFLTYFSEIRQ